MSNDMIKVKYKNKEINDLAKRMHKEYGIIFVNKMVPRIAIKQLSLKLEEYPQTEEKRLLALEYAARIKYEIMKNIDYIYYDVSKDPQYFDYKKSSFAPTKAINDIYGYGIEDIEELPITIENSIEKAYSDTLDHFNKKDNKKLCLKPSLNN